MAHDSDFPDDRPAKPLANIPVCILAGGGARRFGSPKGLAELGGQSLIERVKDSLTRQSCGPLAINASRDSVYADLGRALVPDRLGSDIGPLAGLHAAMVWGEEQGGEHVATVPLDVPFLPGDLLIRLESASAPAIVTSMGRHHPVIGLWPVTLAQDIAEFVEEGGRSAHGWAERCSASHVDFPPGSDGIDPFWNVNTREDLARAHDLGGS